MMRAYLVYFYPFVMLHSVHITTFYEVFFLEENLDHLLTLYLLTIFSKDLFACLSKKISRLIKNLDSRLMS